MASNQTPSSWSKFQGIFWWAGFFFVFKMGMISACSCCCADKILQDKMTGNTRNVLIGKKLLESSILTIKLFAGCCFFFLSILLSIILLGPSFLCSFLSLSFPVPSYFLLIFLSFAHAPPSLLSGKKEI